MAPVSSGSSGGPPQPGRLEQLVAASAIWCHRHPRGVLAAAALLTVAAVAGRFLHPGKLPLGLLAALVAGTAWAGIHFRRLAVVVLLAPLGVGMTWSLGLMGLRLELGLLVLAVGLDQGIHLLALMRSSDAADLVPSFRQAGRTVVPATASIALGLAAVASTGEARELGAAAVGIVLTSVAQLTLVPALLSLRLWSAPTHRRPDLAPAVMRWAPTLGWTAVLTFIALWPHTRSATDALGLSRIDFAAGASVAMGLLWAFRGPATAFTAGLTALGSTAITAGTLMVMGRELAPADALGLTLLFCLALSAATHTADRTKRSLLHVTHASGWTIAGATAAVAISIVAAALVSNLDALRTVLLVGLGVHLLVATAVVPSMAALVESARDSEDKGGLLPRLAVTVGLAGEAPVGPGTLGALVAIPIGFAIQPLGIVPSIAIAVVITAVSIPVTTRYLERTGRHDPSEVVLDELVGCLLAMVMVPFGLVWGWAAFGLFRLFDIAKPGPVRYVERRAAGAWGVIGDDVVAGLMAGAVLLGVRIAGTSLGWWA